MFVNPDWNGNPAMLSDTQKRLLGTDKRHLSASGRKLKRDLKAKIDAFIRPKTKRVLSDEGKRMQRVRKLARDEATLDKIIGRQIAADKVRRETDNGTPYNPAIASENRKKQQKCDRTLRGEKKQLSDADMMSYNGWSYRTFVEFMGREPVVL